MDFIDAFFCVSIVAIEKQSGMGCDKDKGERDKIVHEMGFFEIVLWIQKMCKSPEPVCGYVIVVIGRMALVSDYLYVLYYHQYVIYVHVKLSVYQLIS